MKNLFKVLSLSAIVALFATSCHECPEPEECMLEHMPTTAPTLTLTAGDVTSESISFTITPVDAASVRYIVSANTDALDASAQPTAEDLFNKASQHYGTPADASASDIYFVEGLEMGSDYTVYAAAKNNIGYSELQSLTMTTTIPEPSFSFEIVDVKASSFAIVATVSNIGKIAYIVSTSDEELSAEDIFNNGTELAIDGETLRAEIKGLKPSTQYFVHIAYADLTNGNAQKDVKDATTAEQPAPKVGDYYYADGSWSSELNIEANPIGVIFYLGKHETDTTEYTLKDGQTAMEEFHGYVVAALDATYDAASGSYNKVAWGWQSSWTDDANGTSTSTADFLGYANSQEVLADANGTLTDSSDDNYPAFYYAMVKHEENYAAPETSSGWFLPSAYQLLYIWEEFDPEYEEDALIDNKLAALGEAGLGTKMYVTGGEYWSSTERSGNAESQAMYVIFDYSSLNPGRIDYWYKSYEMRVRPMLAF